MKKILIGANDLIGPWVMKKAGGQYHPGSGQCIGIIENGEILGGIVYENYNGVSLSMHCAAVTPRWVDRKGLFAVFYYPFVQLGCLKVFGAVTEDNLAAQHFDEKVGFKLETRLKDACPGGDLLIYSMRREDCRWIKPKEIRNDATTRNASQPDQHGNSEHARIWHAGSEQRH